MPKSGFVCQRHCFKFQNHFIYIWFGSPRSSFQRKKYILGAESWKSRAFCQWKELATIFATRQQCGKEKGQKVVDCWMLSCSQFWNSVALSVSRATSSPRNITHCNNINRNSNKSPWSIAVLGATLATAETSKATALSAQSQMSVHQRQTKIH